MTKRIPWRDLARWPHAWPVLGQGAPIRPATRCERRNAVEAELVRCGGRRVKLIKDQLDKAPKYSKSTDWNWNRDNDRRVYDYYKVPPYWSV